MVVKFVEMIQARPIYEQNPGLENEDCVLTGLFQVLSNILS